MSPLQFFKGALNRTMVRRKRDKQMAKAAFVAIFSSVLAALPMKIHASAGASGALSLVTEGTARISALGEAGTAIANDIGGMVYNPSSLLSLESGQASLFYGPGLIGDTNGQFLVGSRTSSLKSAWGFSFNYYDAGTIETANADGTTSSQSAQRDMVGNLAFAHNFRGFEMGIAGKYMQSTLLGTYSASTYAFDAGLGMQITSRFRLGASVLNYGNKITYLSEGDNLPRTYNLGASFALLSGRTSVMMLVNESYMAFDKTSTPSVGLETAFGPLALRAGYQAGDLKKLTLGTGFRLGRTNLDYSFGMMNQLDAQHKLSLGLSFGGGIDATPAFAKVQTSTKREIQEAKKRKADDSAIAENVAAPVAGAVSEHRHSLGGETILRAPVRQSQRRVYVVKEGDTLASIARSELGDKRKWQAIYTANRHLIDDPKQIEKGMKIIIP